MKTIPLYEHSIPVFIGGLSNLGKVLDIAETYAEKQKKKPESVLHARLAPDMFDLIQQVQYAYFVALDAAVQLSGRPMPAGFDYDETTFAALRKNLKKAITFLRSITPAQCAKAHTKKLPVFYNPEKKVPALTFVTKLAVPNFFFHCATAYGIVRAFGAPLKKSDYLGPIR
jgi:hypothetical protein